MPTFNIIKEIKPKKSFRIDSIMGKFDIQTEHIKEKFKGEIDLNKDWQIGLIYGHSGTGKSTIAKELFSEELITEFKYKADSILDDMPKNNSIDDITKAFNSVGFSSPPSWLKPYSVLSTGEKMRVDLARAILEKKKMFVFDEFTSVVDRNVAKIGSAAISKAIKRTDKKFIAVSCHEDIIEWLEPDWIFNTNEMKFKYTRGSLRRPEIEIKIYERKGMWDIFRKYHYLNNTIVKSSQQFIGYINNIPVAFCGIIHFPHPKVKNFKRVTRLVVLPDYQGIGIGNKLLNYIAIYYKKNKYRFRITTSTPALMQSFKKNINWHLCSIGHQMHNKTSIFKDNNSINRLTTSWEYICESGN